MFSMNKLTRILKARFIDLTDKEKEMNILLGEDDGGKTLNE